MTGDPAVRSPAGARDPLPAIVEFGRGDVRVRAVILNGSRARADAVLDEFSDTDVAFVVEDFDGFRGDLHWHLNFGQQLIGFPNDGIFLGCPVHNRLVLYRDGVKVDFLCWPSAILPLIAQEKPFPAVLDQGYRVLLDKDGQCGSLPPASGHPFRLQAPTESEFLNLVNEFWWETTYVAKSLVRGDLLHASYNVDVVMKLRVLRRMLDWRIAAGSGWTYDATLLGRGTRNYLDQETSDQLAGTYAGITWATLWRTCNLFSRVARELATALEFTYPDELEAGIRAYLESAETDPSFR